MKPRNAALHRLLLSTVLASALMAPTTAWSYEGAGEAEGTTPAVEQAAQEGAIQETLPDSVAPSTLSGEDDAPSASIPNVPDTETADVNPAATPAPSDNTVTAALPAAGESALLPASELGEPAVKGDTNDPSCTPAQPERGASEPTEPAGDPATIETVADELAPGEGTGKTLPEDQTVYSIASADSGLLVAKGSSDVVSQKPSTTLADYWKLEALGEQRYRIVSSKDGSFLSYTGGGVLGNVGKAVWLVLEHLNETLSLVPEDLAHLRLEAADGSLILAVARDAAAQQFRFTKMAPLTEALQKGAEVNEGIYALASGVGNKQTIDIKGGSKANKGNVQVYTANNTDAQRFTLTSVGGGLYTIKAFHSNRCLDAAGGGTTKGTNVQQYAFNGTLAQLWYLVKGESGYVLHNAKSGLVLDVAQGSAKKGTNVQLYRANGTKAQTFTLERDLPLEAAHAAGKVFEEGIYTLQMHVGSKLVLDVAGGSTAKGANIQAYQSNNTLSQKVELTYLGNGRYTIQSAVSGKYLDIKGGSMASGANVQQWTANKSRAQQWYFVKGASGRYTIASMLSGMVLDVAGSANKANVRVATSNGADAQQFTIKAVPLLADGTYVFSSVMSSANLVEVAGGSSAKGANVQLNRMARSNAQQWVLTYMGNHQYKLVNKASGKVLEVASGSKDKGANVRQWTSNNTPAQRWILGISDTGALTLRNANSGLYLDLKGGKSVRGTNVQQWTGNGTKAQSFVPYSNTSSFVTKGKIGYQNPSQYYQISAYQCVLPSYAKGFFTYVSPSVIAPDATRSQCVEAFIGRAMQYLGTGYIWDWSMAPGQGVDCSGLVMQCLYAVGMQTPYNPYDHMFDPWQDHNAENMHADNKFKKIPFSQRQRGDLIFYTGHVAIYLGNDRIINSTGPGVQIQSVYSWPITGCSRVFV